MGERWNPWAALRARTTTTLEWLHLPRRTGGARVLVIGAEEIIQLDPDLSRRERRHALGHELVHLERGVPLRGAPAALVAKEEHAVEGENARRLVPLDELEVLATANDGTPVMAWELAEMFDVPEPVIRRAMRELELRQARQRHPSGRRCNPD